jgi:aminopeptidase N
MWIHEGFGTYMQALYLEARFGVDAYRNKMNADRQNLSNTTPVAPRETHDTKQIYFEPDGRHNNDIYVKGSWVLHNLRWLLGDDDFFASLRRVTYPDPKLETITDGSQVHFADTDDIVATFSRVSGRNLGWYFEVTLRQPALPELTVARTGNSVELQWSVPEGLPYPMPVPVRIGDRTLRVPMVDGHASVAIGEGEDAVIDPDGWLLAVLPTDDPTHPDS